MSANVSVAGSGGKGPAGDSAGLNDTFLTSGSFPMPPDDGGSDFGGPAGVRAGGAAQGGGNGRVPHVNPYQSRGPSPGSGESAFERGAPRSHGRGFGRGPIPIDTRKFRYDVLRGRAAPAVSFGASKADRMDPVEAGDKLDAIHKMFGLSVESEDRILAFDKALFFEHTINGASMLQPGRGFLSVDEVTFDIEPIKSFLGPDMRRFFRAYADDIALVNKAILDAYDPYDHSALEKAEQLKQVAHTRGLHKFPHLAHDSSDACLNLSLEERSAVLTSKSAYLPTRGNAVDSLPANLRAGPNEDT